MARQLIESLPTMSTSERLEHYVVRTRQAKGLQTSVRARAHRFAIDEPKEWGSDTAANPAEIALGSLGASLEVTCRIYAAVLNVPVTNISTRLEGDLDVEAFLGLAPTKRAGFSQVSGELRVSTRDSIPPAGLRRLAEAVTACCPILDVFRSPVPVDLRLEARGPHGVVGLTL